MQLFPQSLHGNGKRIVIHIAAIAVPQLLQYPFPCNSFPFIPD